MTASRPDTALPVDVRGELRLDAPSSEQATLTAEGSQLRLAVPDWSNLNGLGPRSLRAQRSALATTIGALRVLSLTLDVNVDGHRAFGLGEGVKTTLLARLLGLAQADIRVSTLVRLLSSRAALRHSDRR